MISPHNNARYLFAKVVAIAAFHVDNIAEQALAFHIESEQFRPAVATIFHHHYGRFSALVKPYEFP